MKTVPVSTQRALYLLSNHTETSLLCITRASMDLPDYDPEKNLSLIQHAKNYLAKNNELLLDSGAKLYFNPALLGRACRIEPGQVLYHKTGWFISGYAADGWDVDCYTDPKVMKLMIRRKRIRISHVDVVQDLEAQLRRFLEDTTKRSIYLSHPQIEMYIRRSWRNFGGDKITENIMTANCIDVPRVEVSRKFRGRGLFGAVMSMVEHLADRKYIFIENVSNPWLHTWCRKNNWTFKPNENSYWKLAPNPK